MGSKVHKNYEPYMLPHLEMGVCGIKIDQNTNKYILSSFDKESDMPDEWYVTHYGKCGTCSGLQDLLIYMNTPDMMKQTRRCGMYLMRHKRIKCLKKLGFSPECAQTWDTNIRKTRSYCLGPCILSLITNEPNTKTDRYGEIILNNCLQCDEDVSGPDFVASAGRTCRNSGLISSIERNKREICTVNHNLYMKNLYLTN